MMEESDARGWGRQPTLQLDLEPDTHSSSVPVLTPAVKVGRPKKSWFDKAAEMPVAWAMEHRERLELPIVRR